MKTAREIYERTLHLLGERAGENTASFEERSVELINMLLAELYELDCNLKGEPLSLRGPLPQINSLEDHVGCSDVVAASLIPAGLASFLLYEEEPARAGFFYQIYSRQADQLRARCRRGGRHKIRSPY